MDLLVVIEFLLDAKAFVSMDASRELARSVETNDGGSSSE